MTMCYCGNHLPFEKCCQPYLKGLSKAPTAEALMRSRYSAYVIGEADYVIATTHSSTRIFYKKKEILDWSKSNQWCRLEILEVTSSSFYFKANNLYNQKKKKKQIHYEKSTFIFENGNWFYMDGEY